jgi:hypothetical protein
LLPPCSLRSQGDKCNLSSKKIMSSWMTEVQIKCPRVWILVQSNFALCFRTFDNLLILGNPWKREGSSTETALSKWSPVQNYPLPQASFLLPSLTMDQSYYSSFDAWFQDHRQLNLFLSLALAIECWFQPTTFVLIHTTKFSEADR